MTLAFAGAQLSPAAPGFWLLISILCTALLSSARDLIPPRWRAPLWFANWLLIPYLGLLVGSLSPRLMGLARIDWQATLGLGLGLGFGILVLLVLARIVVDLPEPHPTGEDSAATEPDATHSGWQRLGTALVWAGGLEFHWAFMRGALWEILLTAPTPVELPGYWAVWGAALIAAVEILAVRPTFVRWLVLMTTLVVTSVLFLYTRNFWLCWLVHAAIQLIANPGAHLPQRWTNRVSSQRR
jgi:hypothetical protein